MACQRLFCRDVRNSPRYVTSRRLPQPMKLVVSCSAAPLTVIHNTRCFLPVSAFIIIMRTSNMVTKPGRASSSQGNAPRVSSAPKVHPSGKTYVAADRQKLMWIFT